MSPRPPSGGRTSFGTTGFSSPLAAIQTSLRQGGLGSKSPSQCSQDGDDLPAAPSTPGSSVPPSPMAALTPHPGPMTWQGPSRPDSAGNLSTGGLSRISSGALASGLGSLVGNAWSMTPEMVHLKDLVSLRDTPPEAREDWQVQRILALALGTEGCGILPCVPGEEGASWSIIKGAPVNLQAALARQGCPCPVRVSVSACLCPSAIVFNLPQGVCARALCGSTPVSLVRSR
jgi:hypothetical protein